jgi:hypothetical protein
MALYYNTDPTLEERQAYDAAIERLIAGTGDVDDNGDSIGRIMMPPWVWTDQQLCAYIRSRFDDRTATFLSLLSDYRDLATNSEDVQVNVLVSPILELIKRVKFRSSSRFELFGHDGSGGRVQDSHRKLHDSDLLAATIREQVRESTLAYSLFLRDLSYITERAVERELKRLGTSLQLMIACVREAYQVLFGIEPNEWDCQFFDTA